MTTHLHLAPKNAHIFNSASA